MTTIFLDASLISHQKCTSPHSRLMSLMTSNKVESSSKKLGRTASNMFENNGQLWCPLPVALNRSNISCICGGGYTFQSNIASLQDTKNDEEAGDAFSLIHATDSSTQCVRCPNGMYSNETTEYQCSSCPKGWIPVSSVQNEVPGFMWEARYAELKTRGMDRCGQCPPGSFINLSSALNKAECQLCPPGTSNAKPGQYACDPCSAGHFSATEGAETCMACNPGTFTENEGSTECLLCPPGTFSRWAAHAKNTGIAECLPCPRGSYQELAGSPKCIPCPVGTVARLPGMPKCLSCRPGSYIDLPTASCMPCEPGTFSTKEGVAECEICPPGTTTETFGNRVCSAMSPAGRGFVSLSDLNANTDPFRPVGECQPGTYNSGKLLSCHLCPRGTYTAQLGANECTSCPAGSYSPDFGMTKCLDSPAGYFVGEIGAWKPTRCPANQFTPRVGSTRCENCPEGTFAVFGGGLSCDHPRNGEILQQVEWPRVRMTLMGMTLADFHERFSSNATGNLPVLNSSIANTRPAKAAADSVRLALDLFAVENVKLHVISIEIASAVEDMTDVVIDLAIEKVPIQLSNRGKLHSASFEEQFKLAKVSALELSSVTKKNQEEEERTQGTGAISSLLGGVKDAFNFFSKPETAEPASEIQANTSQGLAETVASEGFRRHVGRNLGLTDALKRPISKMLVQMELLSEAEAWRTTRAVACPPGSFFSLINSSCELCQPGFFSNESGVLGCRKCPKGSFSDEPGMEACEECSFGSDSRAGSTRCTKCSWFTIECSDFAEHILITTGLALALLWKVYRRLRAVFYGDRRALQRSEDTVLLATVRTYGRTFGGARYAAMVSHSKLLWLLP